MIDLAIPLERADPRPLRRQLADYVRSLIGSGRLVAGEKLPASRDLAAALGIGRNTVAQAYQCLVDEGVLFAHVGQGTFVAAVERRDLGCGADGSEGVRPFAWEGLFSSAARNRLPEALLAEAGGSPRFDFRPGRVAADHLPLGALRRTFMKALKSDPRRLSSVDGALGVHALREQIARLLVSRGIECAPDDVLVTQGAQQGLDLVCRALIDPGDAVAVEQPGYMGAWIGFRAAGARLISIPVDSEGMRMDVLARELRTRRIKLVYTTPAAQLPTGAVLSDPRRRSLLDLADATQTPILEDDYDSEFRFGDPAPPALKTLDRAGQVVYVGTFSKAVMPGLRLGYVVAARPLLEKLAVGRFSATLGADVVTQFAMAELLSSGALERHVRGLRRLAKERRSALLEALAESMPGDVCWTTPSGGLSVWLGLPERIDLTGFHAATRAAGIAYGRGESCFFDGRGSDHLMLCFATQDPKRLRAGVKSLAREIERRCRARRKAS